MKSFLLAAVFLISLLPSARAQMDADDQYIAIYGVVQQADTQIGAGEPQQALASLTAAQAQLQKFQKQYPDWNPGIISYRLDAVAKKIATLQAQVAAVSAPVPPVADTNGISAAAAGKLSAPAENLRAELAAVQSENQVLQAKLKEALASQPAAVDAGELARAQEQVRSLMKENDLLKAGGSGPAGKKGGAAAGEISSLRQQLADALNKYSTEHSRAEKLAAENAALPPAANGAAANDLSARLQSANTQIVSLKTEVTVAALEKSALESKVRQLSAAAADLRATNDEGRIRELTAQRDELAKELASAGKKTSRKGADAHLAALNDEMEALRARLAVDEAKPAPYAPDELALFRPGTPQPNSDAIKRSIHELPSGTAELVTSAQQHFARQEYDQAGADYQKILARDQNNSLALANLATIELQQGKLAAAEKHINAALAQSPDDAYNLCTLGSLKFRQEKYDEALDILSRAVKLDPNNPEIQNYLGVTLSHKGLRVQAETALRKAIEINPLYAPAHYNLTVVYLNQTPPSPLLARWHYEKAVAAGQPRNPDLEKQLADQGAPVN
jgi:cytochrome c-type biogenesis protein CcmH/NrfG